MSVRLSVIIVNWRSKDYVRQCLRKLETNRGGIGLEIIVVDGGSFDGCGEMLREEFPAVVFIQSPENVGFGRSNNLGLAAATCEMVLLLNPDTEVEEDALAQKVAELERSPRAGLVGPRLLNTDRTLQQSSVMALPTPLNQALRSDALMRLFPRSGLWGSGAAYAATQPVAVEAVSGACMLLRASVMRSLGGFSPAYFMYAEDMDLCARVRELGLDVIHVPAAVVVHHGGGSSRTQVSKFSTLKMRSAVATFIRLHQGVAAVLAYRVLQGCSALLRIVLLLPTMVAGRKRRTESIASMTRWGYVALWSVGLAR